MKMLSAEHKNNYRSNCMLHEANIQLNEAGLIQIRMSKPTLVPFYPYELKMLFSCKSAPGLVFLSYWKAITGEKFIPFHSYIKTGYKANLIFP
jgi:hypothetical protein